MLLTNKQTNGDDYINSTGASKNTPFLHIAYIAKICHLQRSKALSCVFHSQHALGAFPDELFDEEVPCNAITEFQKDLKTLEASIEQRNATIALPYFYLIPKMVENSVAI